MRFPLSDIICKNCKTAFREHRLWCWIYAILAMPATFLLVWSSTYVPWPYGIYLVGLGIFVVFVSGAFIPLVKKKNQEGVRSVLEDFL